MRKFKLFALCAIALAGAASGAKAATDFSFTGAVVTWTVPTTGFYQIVAYGAQGGDVLGQTQPNFLGGRGAEVGGDAFLTAGLVLNIAVGQAGNGRHLGLASGGGGGSWVFTDVPLVIAGGGGGAAFEGGSPGQDGQITSGSGLGGVGHDGGGGGGWMGNGSDGGSVTVPGIMAFGTGGSGPPSFAGGSTVQCGVFGCNASLATGGFGGGGGSGFNLGGGGGGYTGGDGGSNGRFGGGGGGTSYLDASFLDTIAFSGVRSGNGFVHISDVMDGPTPVPEPTTWALMLAGFLSAGVGLRRRRASTARTA